ncbi:MAG: histidine phosphotransferase [Hyphomicrobiales bacterium]|nr:MAG: histidine phosphotransferase [Hyphomicrobiales bacterium]
MTGTKPDELELAALLCSRVCHDVISPVGAIINGLEVLDEGDDEEMASFAMDLIRKSAGQASAKLQFARLAFGAAGSAGASIDLAEAAEVAKRFASDDKTTLNWDAVPVAMPKDYVKIALNMVLVAISAIPRGGVIDVDVQNFDAVPRFIFSCNGLKARIADNLEALMAGEPGETAMDARAVQPYYLGLVARRAGMKLHLSQDGDRVLFTAEAGGQEAA